MEKCPKCGYERRPTDSECPKCGIVYAKWEAYVAKKKAEEENLRRKEAFVSAKREVRGK